MKRSALVGVAALSLLDIAAGTAEAQNFGGAYVGAHAGYRWVDMDVATPAYSFSALGSTFNVPARDETFKPSGMIFGLHTGYNLMITPVFLLGVESDITGALGSDDRSTRILATDGGSTALRYTDVRLGAQGTVRVRAGVVTGPTLIYLIGGVAFADFKWNDTITFGTTVTASKSEILTGWTIGGGVEAFVTLNATVRLEYLYEDFGSVSVPLARTTKEGEVDVTAHKLRVGVSYKF